MNRLATIDGTIKTPPSVAATKYSRYPTYVSTGSVWLGELPGHWKMRRLKFSLGRNDGGVWGDDFDSEGTVVLRSTEQTVGGGWNIVEPARRSLSATERAAGLLATDDLLITKSSGSELHIGKTSIVTEEVASLQCCFSNFMQRLRCSHGLLPKLVFYVLNSPIGREQFVYGSNTTTGLANLNGHVIGNLVLAVPPLDEQRAIAAFLDRETARIDALIAKKQRLIELLQEKRTALISHAFTRGITKHAPPTKPAGKWLDKCPAHWKLLPLKWLVTAKITDGPHETPEILDEGVPFVSAEAIQKGRINFEAKRGYISRDLHEQYCRKCRPRRDDVFLCKSGATTGKVAIVETDDEFSVWSPLAQIRAHPQKVLARFLYLAIQADYVQNQIQQLWSHGTQPNIAMGVIEILMLAVPPLEEQAAILNYVQERDKRIEALSRKADDTIDHLGEYRSALISAAVTGKIDVRSASERDSA